MLAKRLTLVVDVERSPTYLSKWIHFRHLVLLLLIFQLFNCLRVSYTSPCTHTGRKPTAELLPASLFSSLCAKQLTFKFEFQRCATAQAPITDHPIRIQIPFHFLCTNQIRACPEHELSLYDKRLPDPESVNTDFTKNLLCSKV